MQERFYFDWNASAPLRPEARRAMLAAVDATGNPSSVHGEGRAARRFIEEAREHVAKLVGAEPRDVVFTSGGTEANVLALAPSVEPGAKRYTKLFVSSVEHPSVLAGGRFAASDTERLPVDGNGLVDLAALVRALAEAPPPVLVSLMLANNETGVFQPVAEAASLVHEAGGTLHVDAVQAPGRIRCDINRLQADLLSISAHKIGGPRGVGALIRRGPTVPFPAPLIRGGGQERRLRGGTENVSGIAGFGAAASAVLRQLDADHPHVRALQARLEAGLKGCTPDVVIFGEAVDRLPNTTLFSLPGMKAETGVIAFDLEGIAVSSGAACSSGKVGPSHVLAAMGVPAGLAAGAIRVSCGPDTRESDVDRLLEAWIKLAKRLPKALRVAAA